MKESINIPSHVAVIMDGNGRWAGKFKMERLWGHKKGVDSVRSTVEAAIECGVRYLTLYAFSSENWARPKDEVFGIMNIITSALETECEKLHKNGVKIMVIGDRSQLSPSMLKVVERSEAVTEDNNKLVLMIAINYGSKEEILTAVKSIAQKVKDGKIEVEDITKERISLELSTGGMPDPDLMIRTSGESRISNFLLWQMAYTELYFTDVMWPEFTKEEFYKAIKNYSHRKRRFGAL